MCHGIMTLAQFECLTKSSTMVNLSSILSDTQHAVFQRTTRTFETEIQSLVSGEKVICKCR